LKPARSTTGPVRFVKFSSGLEAEDPHEWGDVFARVTMSDGNERLEIGVSKRQVTLVQLLSAELEPPYGILYVLIVPRDRQNEGRYELVSSLEPDELTAFFERYRVVFEQDGRHAVWVQSASGQLVFTPHDIIYAYGPIEAFRAVLQRRDFVEKPVHIPAPHGHHYHPQFDPVVRDLLSRYSWTHYPLQELDDET
jgi:hypothetical protein